MMHLLTVDIVPCAVLLGIALLTLRWCAPASAQRAADLLNHRYWLFISVLMLIVYGAALGCSLYLPIGIDVIEVSVSDISSLFLRGLPIYTSLGAANRYSLLYGPLCYLPFSLALGLFGPSLASLKLAVFLLNVGLFLMLWVAFRRILTRSESLVALSFIAAALMMKGMTTFMIRGDICLALTTALALFSTSLHRQVWAIVLLALATAVAIDIKFTAVFYLLVPCYFLWRRYGHLATLKYTLLAAFLALSPFWLQNVSLRNYLAWIHQAAHHPLELTLFAGNVVVALILTTPIVLMSIELKRRNLSEFQRLKRAHWPLIVAFVLSVLGSVLTGSKMGAGRPHLNSTFIVAAWLAAMLWSKAKVSPRRFALRFSLLPFAFAVYSLCLVVPAISQLREMKGICFDRRSYALDVVDDLKQVERLYPKDRIEIGYTETPGPDVPVNDLTMFRPQVVLNGNPVTVDAGALFDMGLSGLTIPQATIDSLHSCGTQVWLIPKDGKPFAQLNPYAYEAPGRFPDPLLFDQRFRDAFFETYRQTGSSRFYNIWTCDTRGAT